MKKEKLTTALLVVVLLTGLGLLLYPPISNYWNSKHQTRAINDYVEQLSSKSAEEFAQIWEEVEAYNRDLLGRRTRFALPDELNERYYELLDVSGTGMMGYVMIPSIEVELPVYHGTDNRVLQVGVGHLEWSSLPSGGENTHTVVSGHRGLPSAKLFTDLDRLEVGDLFWLSVLDRDLCFEIDQILIVKPNETDELVPVSGKSYCTLVTCTPYGINSHRILIRGHRIETEEQTVIHINADGVLVEPLIVAPVFAVPLLLLFILYLVFFDKRRRDGKPDALAMSEKINRSL